MSPLQQNDPEAVENKQHNKIIRLQIVIFLTPL